MFISRKEYFEEVHAVLQLGVDFEKEDLTDECLKSLKANVASKIAFDKGFLKWSWLGHYNEKSETIEITFQNPIFVDEAAGTVITR